MLEDPWEEVQEKERRRMILPTLVGWLLFVFFLITMAVIFAADAHARPLYRFSLEGLTVTLHSERCALREVLNLPGRATWEEAGKQAIEGCYGYDPRYGIVVTYWTDRTIVLFDGSMFVTIQEASLSDRMAEKQGYGREAGEDVRSSQHGGSRRETAAVYPKG